jgi:hypothetical protein
MKIIPINVPGAYRTGELSNITSEEISKILGFRPNVSDDTTNVNTSWGFEVDGQCYGIWDWRGSAFQKKYSTYGNPNVLHKIFGERHTP